MKKIIRKINYGLVIQLLILILLSLMPLLWLPDNTIIAGHDAGAPLNPIGHFIDRLYVWTTRWGIGADQSYAVGAFFIHGLEALAVWLGANLRQQQISNYIFWLLLPALTMFFSMRYIFTDRKYIPLISSVLFMFNHFLLQGWFVAERTKFSIYAALPIIFVVYSSIYLKKTSVVKAALISAITISLLNGGGNLPLYGALMVMIMVMALFFIYTQFSWRTIKKSIEYFVILGISTICLSAFWILPYFYFVLHQFGIEVDRAGGIDGVIGWANVISANTSFLNLMRLQGIPDWYQNPYHAYSNNFLNNPLLIAISFIFPLLALGALYYVKRNKDKVYILLLLLICLFGMFFAAGTHPPTGSIYELMLRFIPGFLMFRTPFYKFAPLIWFSYSILIAYSMNYFLEKLSASKLSSKVKLPQIIIIFVIIGIVMYNYPFINGTFFDYEKNRKTMRLSVPSYIYEFQKWADGSSNKTKRSLLIPGLRNDNKMETYNWGYQSLSSLTTLLTRETFMVNAFYNTKTEDIILNNLYENLLNSEEGWEELAALLGITNFVVRGDYKWDAYGSPTRRPDEYENSLNQSSLIRKTNQFGEWRIYSFTEDFVNPIITVTDDMSLLNADTSMLRYTTSVPDFKQKIPIYFLEQNKILGSNISNFVSGVSHYYYFPICVNCDLKNIAIPEASRRTLLLPGSPLYAVIRNREAKLRSSRDTTKSKIDFLLSISLRRLQEMKRMSDLNINMERIGEPLLEHTRLIDELDQTIGNLANYENEEGNKTLLLLESYLDLESSILKQIFTPLAGTYEKEINTSYDAVNHLLEKIRLTLWRTYDEYQKKYVVTLEDEGEYQILLRRDRLEIPDEVIEDSLFTLELVIDGISYNVKPEIISNSWLLLKSINLSKGYHKILFPLKPLELFSHDKFSFIGDSNNLLKDQSTYTIRSNGDQQCIVFKNDNLTSGSTYRVSFQHKKNQGNQNIRAIVSQLEETPKKLTMRGDSLSVKDEWNDFTIDQLLLLSNTLYLTVCTEIENDSSLKEMSEIVLRNLSLRKISSPILVLKLVDEEKEIIQEKKSFEFERINQTKYKVHINETNKPYFLTLSQRFSPDWKLYPYNPNQIYAIPILLAPDSIFSIGNLWRKSLSESYHFVSNGYANTWYIKDEETNDFIIEYRPQQLLYISFAISLLSLTLIIGIILLLSKKKSK